MIKHEKETSFNYYLDELKQIITDDEYGYTIQVTSSKGKTKFMSLNRESEKAFEKFLTLIQHK